MELITEGTKGLTKYRHGGRSSECHGSDSLDDAKASLLEGVRLWVEVTKKRGEAIPKPSTIATDTIEVPAA